MLIRRARAGCHVKGALIAHDDIVADNSSLMVESNDPQAVKKYLHLCNEAAYVNNKTALVRTEALVEVWTHEFSSEYAKDQESVVSGVRWRQSRLGGRCWANPPFRAAVGGGQERASPAQGFRGGSG